MKSRYDNINVSMVDGKEMITSTSVNINRKIPTDKIKTKIIQTNDVTRLDAIAHKYLGNSRYWWVIAVINGLYGNFWRIERGSKLMIPENINDVLDYF